MLQLSILPLRSLTRMPRFTKINLTALVWLWVPAAVSSPNCPQTYKEQSRLTFGSLSPKLSQSLLLTVPAGLWCEWAHLVSGDLLGASVGTVHLHLRTGAPHVILQNHRTSQRKKEVKRKSQRTRRNITWRTLNMKNPELEELVWWCVHL